MCYSGHQLIADGWSVLPLSWTDEAGGCAGRRHHSPKNAGKSPLTAHGVDDATTDLAQVDVWSNRWPRANWGIACTGVTVVDIYDTDLAALLKEHAELKQHHCKVSTLRRNGLHIYLKEDDPVHASRVLFSQDGRRLGEIQRAGRYVVGPGSRIGSGHYRPITNNATGTIEDADDWLTEALYRFGIALRRAPMQSLGCTTVDTEGVDSQGALDKALNAIDPLQAERLQSKLQASAGHSRFSLRSEVDFATVSELIEAGLSDSEVASVWKSSELGQRPKVQRRPDYVARTIANAHARIDIQEPVGTSASTPHEPTAESESVVREAVKAAGSAVQVGLLRAVNQVLAVRTRAAQFLREDGSGGSPASQESSQEFSELSRDGPRLIGASPGVGKTHLMVELAQEPYVWARVPMLHLVPRHKSFYNVTRCAGWGHWRGHDIGEDGRDACPAYVLANKGYRTGHYCNCSGRAGTIAQGLFPTVAPVEYALADSPNSEPLRKEAMQFPLWVLDDVGLDKFVNTMVIDRHDVELTAQHHPYESAQELARALIYVLDRHTLENQEKPLDERRSRSGTNLYEHLVAAFEASGSSMSWSVRTLRANPQPWPDDPWMPDEHSTQALPINFIPRLVDLLTTEWMVHITGLPPGNPLVHVVWDSPKHGQPKQSNVRVLWRRFLAQDALHKLVVFDASGDPTLWSTVLGAPVTEGETGNSLLSPAGMPFPEAMLIVQMRDTRLGKTTLEHFDWEGSVAIGTIYIDLLCQEIKARKDLGQAKKVGIISFRELIPDCLDALKGLGYKFSEDRTTTEVVTGYYYNLRGANDFTGCDLLILLGYPMPNPQGLYEGCCVLFQDDPEPILTEPAPYSDRIRLRNGNSVAVSKSLFGYKDARLNAILMQKSRSELYQVLHRPRPFAPATSMREVLIFTDVPGVPVDTFFGRDGRMFDCLDKLLGACGEGVTLLQLVYSYRGVCGPQDDIAKRDSQIKWIKRNAPGLSEATNSVFVSGEGKGQTGVFRTSLIYKVRLRVRNWQYGNFPPIWKQLASATMVSRRKLLHRGCHASNNSPSF